MYFNIYINKHCGLPVTYLSNWSRIKTGYLHIWDIYYMFINHKFTPFAITHRISKCLEYIIRKLFKLRYVRTSKEYLAKLPKLEVCWLISTIAQMDIAGFDL